MFRMWQGNAIFSHIFSENFKKKAEQKDWKNSHFGQKRNTCKPRAKKGMLVEKISAVKEKPSILR